MSNGKGSMRRPKQIADAELAERWAATFDARVHHLQLIDNLGQCDCAECQPKAGE